jgi:hypothetical protein
MQLVAAFALAGPAMCKPHNPEPEEIGAVSPFYGPAWLCTACARDTNLDLNPSASTVNCSDAASM